MVTPIADKRFFDTLRDRTNTLNAAIETGSHDSIRDAINGKNGDGNGLVQAIPQANYEDIGKELAKDPNIYSSAPNTKELIDQEINFIKTNLLPMIEKIITMKIPDLNIQNIQARLEIFIEGYKEQQRVNEALLASMVSKALLRMLKEKDLTSSNTAFGNGSFKSKPTDPDGKPLI